MKVRTFQRNLFFLLLLSIGISPLLSAAEFPVDRRILMVFGNPDIGPWEQNFNQIILQELATNAGVPVIPEFLSLINASEGEQSIIAESLRLKYSAIELDLVIAVLPEANAFVDAWADTFAVDVPILFVLPGFDVSREITTLEPGDAIIRTAAGAAATDTLALMQRLNPELQQLFVVGGASAGDASYLSLFENALEVSDLSASVSFLRGLTPEELLASLADAPVDSAILIGTYDTDTLGQSLRTLAVTAMLVDNLPIPVYSVFDSQIEAGALGGNVTSSTLYARQTGDIALAMVRSGYTGDEQPPATQFLFNGTSLNAFDINRSLLPPGSIIINDIDDSWRQYLIWFSLGSIIILLQLLLIAALIRSMRQQKRVEAELREVHKMEALGNLAGGIAHDFNNVLMAIMANTEMASLNLHAPEEASKQLKNIISASERAKRLITQILMFSRRQQVNDFEKIDVQHLLEESAEQIRSFSPDACTFNISCEPDLWHVEANATQIHQVIMNLCMNAQYAMENRGEITIRAQNSRTYRTRKLIGHSMPPGEYVSITISDNGQGISEEHMTRVFEPFFTTKPRGKGTGLGLALVYGIIKSHSGYLDLQSVVGKGTSVTVYLKTGGVADAVKEDRNTSLSKDGIGERILLVDDDEMVADVSSKILSRLGYAVHSYSRSMEALQQFSKHPDQYDLLMTDLSMPEMDGIRLITKVRNLRPELPVVLCTGYLNTLDSLDLDNVIVLKKPARYADISDAVSRALNAENTDSP